MVSDLEVLAFDLLSRVETAVQTIARISEDTGVTFKIVDIVAEVEKTLPPAFWPGPGPFRTEFLTDAAIAFLSGEAYDYERGSGTDI